MKNQLSQTKDYLKKQMAMGYQIQGETCTEEIPGDVFEQLSKILQRNNIPTAIVEKCRKYVKDYDQLNHFVHSFSLIERVFKDQLRAQLSQSDLVKLKQTIERQK